MGAKGRRQSVLQAAALLAALLVPAAQAAAAEPGFEVIDTPLSAAQVIDLDRDGARDLVVMAAEGQPRLEWWSLEGGNLELVASLELPAPTTFDVVSMRPVEWAGRPRLLLLLAEGERATGQLCCTTMYWVDAAGRELTVTPIAGTLPEPMEALIPFDAEDDGTDELLAITGIASDEQAARPVQLLRFAGARLAPVGAPVQMTRDTGWSEPGDTDGLPGAEIIVGPNGAGELLRIGTGPGGQLRTETAEMPDLARNDGGGGGWVVAATEGRLLVQTDGAVSVMTWPVGGTPAIEARTEGVWAMGPPIRLEGGTNVIAVQSMDDPPALSIVDMHLEERGGTAWPRTIDAWWELAERHHGLRQIEGPYPTWGHVGPLGHGGTGWMIEGSLLRIGEGGTPEVLIEGGLAGVAPVGSMGPQDGWVVLAQRNWGFSEFEYLPSGGDAAVGGLVVVPLDELVLPTWAPDVRLAGGGVTLRQGWAAVAEPAVSFEIEAPPGSRIVAVLNDRIELDARMEQSTTQVTMTPTRRDADDPEMEALVLVSTPLGRTAVAEWTVDVMRDPPRLEATEETAAPGLASVVSGTTEPGATVMVDGRPVEVAGDGSFSVRVDASPWPRDLRIVATSIVGRESVAVLSVIGLFDWRPVPWQTGMALVTVAVGVVLFVTAGRRRPPPRVPLAGEGEWIEFEGPIGDVTWVDPTVPSARAARLTAAGEGDERVE